MLRDETYRGQVDPITADKRGRVIPHTTLRKKTIDLSVARIDEPFRLEGDFLFADRDTTGTASVRLNSVAEDAWPITAQDGVVDLPIRDVFITNAAQAGKVLNLWYGYRARFLAGANSIASIGSIITPINLDPEDARYFLFGDDESLDGEAFSGQGAAGPVAGQVSHIQLWNPAGSGRVVYLDGLALLDRSGGDTVNFAFHNASIGVVSAAVSNKSLGGAAPVAEVRNGTSGGGIGTAIAQYNTVSVPLLNFKAPFRLPPGFGLIASGLTVNHLLVASFEWREKAT